MGKSDDNTNELESYGVWVKNSTENDKIFDNEENKTDDLTLDDGTLDLPDFDDSDFSDMFKDDSQFSTETKIDIFDTGSTTLSTDELTNITENEDVSVEQVETPLKEHDEKIDDSDVDVTDTISDSSEVELDDFDTYLEDTNSSDEPVAEEADEEENKEEESGHKTDSFDLDEVTETTDSIDTAAEDTEEDNAEEDNAEEEISLDDFMDGGFSDESVASGNNGYEAGNEPVSTESETEELSLDDFMDDDSFSSAPDSPKEDNTIEDEPPLDMDISFDDSEDEIKTEDSIIDDDSYENMDTADDIESTESSEPQESSATETEVPFDDFANETVNMESDDGSTEEIDLSDFGIDANAEEIPITQDVEASKAKDKIIDYDLSVGDEDTASAPVVNEVKQTDEQPSKTAESEKTTKVDNSLLEQIVSELSSLKNEMNVLKKNIEDIKSEEHASKQEFSEKENDDTSEEKNEGGFFSSDDEDDTIALSGDELNNIFNTADFGPVEDVSTGKTPNVEDSNEEPLAAEPVGEDSEIDDDIKDLNTIDEPVIDATTISEDEKFIDQTSDANTEIEDAPVFDSDDSDTQNDIDFKFSDENLEEPEIDETTVESNIEDFEEDAEDLPSEISIQKDDDMFVESNSSDFMDSVKDSTETFNQEEQTEIVDTEDIPEALPEDAVEENAERTEENGIDDSDKKDDENSSDDDIPTVDKLLSSDSEKRPSEETVTVDEEQAEPVIEETSVDIPESDDTEDDFLEVDNLDNNLTDSNINFLSAERASDENDSSEAKADNSDLKQDIKSVLLYMDQLLENLPEEKIIEFAKSDEFVTYKKLFNELGLN
ncbi:hypothetical protein [Treponema sp. Marseille-Q3903]|uniref:hypothetical protein n=1 Tax=Treponema sp. Marseille-Q3903 TaxID=2766703 RepID=UPI001652340D|nr:hypothetical protein [Treponema sp. Marseille-Q3903]MBC6713712.1 hypothetical protein [Treponema sp. Marseille-Q3903]